jgi:hypothetical protein
MKAFMFLTFAAFLGSVGANAAIVETKLKVTTRYYDSFGETRKLLNTRAFVRYNNSVDALSSKAKDDCMVISGKRDFLSLFSEVEKSECISNKTFVITTSDIITDMIYRPATFDIIHDDISNIQEIIRDNGKITNATAKDQGHLGSIRSLIRNAFSSATETQTISLIGRTVFTLKGNGRAKFVMELEPIETKILNN